VPPVRKIRPKATDSSTRKATIKGRNSSKTSGGLGRVKQAVKRAAEKKEAMSHRWLRLEDGDSVVARVLDVGENFRDAYTHRTPMQGKNGTYHADVPCLDQDEDGTPCPGCKKELRRSYKFWTNVLVRDWEDDEGKTADRIMIWSGGITIARRLNKMHERHGLHNRDIVIEREGSTKDDTKYDIDWADDSNTPLSEEDEVLAKNRHDIERYVKIPDYDDFFKSPRERGEDDEEDQEETGRNALNRNVFQRKRSERKKGTTSRIKAGGSKTTTVRRRSR
jgi:hypothetical protein